jgi:hypothetical protein
VMNNRSMDSILSSKVKLGGDASIAGGPKGRTATGFRQRACEHFRRTPRATNPSNQRAGKVEPAVCPE